MTRLRQIAADLLDLVAEVWGGMTDPTYVLFSSPPYTLAGKKYEIQRHFARCRTCGRVFMHYWGCVTASDREKGRQVGCKCGGDEMKVCILPVWQQVWFLFSRYLWRKVWKNEQFWDPRLAERVEVGHE